MTERQLFLAIGEVDATMVAAAVPFEQRRPFYGWLLAAAAAVVVGVIGYAALADAWRNTPPVQPPPPATVATTTETVTDTTTTTGSTPVTPPTAPNGLPLLTSDGRLDAEAEGGGTVPYITAFSFAELQIESVTQAPATLPVYTVDFGKFDEAAELKAIVEHYVGLTEDTLVEPITISEYGGSASAEGKRFRFSISPPFGDLGTHNSVGLWLQQPFPMGTTDEWLSQVMAHCPQLFAHMSEPALMLVNGVRDLRLPEGEAWRADDEVSFRAYVYDAAINDEAAKWLNSVSFYVFEGNLMSYTVYLVEHYDAVGDYPILSVEEAKAAVRQMYEQTSNEWINADFEILSVELEYIPASMSCLRVPFYRFLLAADDTEQGRKIYKETGMTMFYEKYICAVPENYWAPETDDLLVTQR